MSILALLGFQAVLWTPTSYNKEILIFVMLYHSGRLFDFVTGFCLYANTVSRLHLSCGSPIKN